MRESIAAMPDSAAFPINVPIPLAPPIFAKRPPEMPPPLPAPPPPPLPKITLSISAASEPPSGDFVAALGIVGTYVVLDDFLPETPPIAIAALLNSLVMSLAV